MSSNVRYKIFPDPIYGHIRIPSNFCTAIIDTDIFQRLRRIEQTSIRSIFPCANYTRFTHSLGTYHIGQRIFSYIESNTKNWMQEIYSDIETIKKENWEKLGIINISEKSSGAKTDIWERIKTSYEIACLLHDCGHAPFSHAFEDYYKDPDWKIRDELLNEYSNYTNDISLQKPNRILVNPEIIIEDFKNDIRSLPPNPHELVSAWLALHPKGFRRRIVELGGEPLLVARMITGYAYGNYENDKAKQFLNCIISLLNGHEVDADRIDYTLRGSWVSDNNSRHYLNLDKLIATIHINLHDNCYQICYKKTVLPEIESLVDAKNHNFFWIIHHHKVLYDAYLLKKAVEKLALLLSGEQQSEKPEELCESNNILPNYLYAKDQQKNNLEENDNTIKSSFANEALHKLFDYHSFIEPIQFKFKLGEEQYVEDIYLLSDDDIIYLLKKYFLIDSNFNRNPLKDSMNGANFAKEWLTRDHLLKPVWKNPSEYKYDILEVVINHNLSKGISSNDTDKGHSVHKAVDDVINKIGSIVSTYIKIPALGNLGDYLKENSIFKDTIQSLIRGKLSLTDLNYDAAARRVLERIDVMREDRNIQVKRNTYKILDKEYRNIEVKEIKYNNIYIKLDGENGKVVKLSELGLPKKNIARSYNLVHVYLPKIYKMDTEIEHSQYEEFHKKYLIEEIKKELRDMSDPAS